MSIIQHDVKRLDRLISDISDASRLDAELARADAEPVDMVRLLEAVVSVANERRQDARTAHRAQHRAGTRAWPGRLPGARPRQPARPGLQQPDRQRPLLLAARRDGAGVAAAPQRTRSRSWSRTTAPASSPHALDRIFERFYTDRPEQGFGQNSGLGLSISRQIIEAHRGTIRAENRLGPPDETGEPTRLGARFIVRLPIEGAKAKKDQDRKDQEKKDKARREPGKREAVTAVETIHAGCVLVGEAGLLIRGPSGSGKSTLARELIARRQRDGPLRDASSATTAPASKERHGRLLARPVRSARRLIEVRGLGIVRQSFEAAAVVRLSIDLCDDRRPLSRRPRQSILSYAASWSLAFACRPAQSRLTSPWAA